ncbi:MAG: TatD family hydrolase, partial [Actinobacteria bacterium]|nr:TatD family hydrolase [Actinomycetota bacterium]
MDDGNPPAKLHGGAVDTHCHLFLLEGEPRRVLERARAAGVNTVVCVGIDPKSSRRSVEL